MCDCDVCFGFWVDSCGGFALIGLLVQFGCIAAFHFVWFVVAGLALRFVKFCWVAAYWCLQFSCSLFVGLLFC